MIFSPILQGGMGVGVSNWSLARAVALAGQTGVVSGTALDAVLVRRLQLGDLGGHLRRAMRAFPVPAVVRWVMERYFSAEGKPVDRPFAGKPMVGHRQNAGIQALLVLANFVEVFLAKEGHDGPIGINYLEKVQPPTLPSLYGAMLAGVDLVVMGAGIPREIPRVLERLTRHEPVQLPIHGAEAADAASLSFDPRSLGAAAATPLARPRFFPIVSSFTLGQMMARKASGPIDGLVIEGPVAGGHNAPPRGPLRLSVEGEPIYGPRDLADPADFAALGLPFWLAGGQGRAGALAEAQAAGAEGIQVGTLFAFCHESGLREDLKAQVIAQVWAGSLRVRTDARASPTGYPFKVLQLPGTGADPQGAPERPRRCDLGYLRSAFTRADGQIDWRCPSERFGDFERKGGPRAETEGRQCLCNALMANIGLGQVDRQGRAEAPLLTCGENIGPMAELLGADGTGYSAAAVIRYLLAQTSANVSAEAPPEVSSQAI